MKKLILCTTIFMLTFQVGLAQWTSPIFLDTYVPSFAPGDFQDVNFISKSAGLFSYSYYYSPSGGSEVWVKATNDAGDNWKTVWNDQDQGVGSYAIHTVIEQSTFYHIRNWQGFVITDKSVDNGLTWDYNALRCDGWYQDFSAVDTSHLFLLSKIGYYGKYFINKYVNGILSTKIDSFQNEQAHLLFFANADTGYIAASPAPSENNNFIYKSTTGGAHWEKVFSDSLMNIRKMYFTSANIGYAVGDSGKVIKTIDGGSNWQYLQTNTTLNLNSTFFINDTIGYVAGDSGLIIKTMDGGVSWSRQHTGSVYGFSKIFFVNDSIGFALNNQYLFKTNQSLPLGYWEIVPFKNKVSVFPNPFSSETTLQADYILHNATLTIVNSFGQTVNLLRNINGQTITFGRENLASGLYFLLLTENDKSLYADKLVISN